MNTALNRQLQPARRFNTPSIPEADALSSEMEKAMLESQPLLENVLTRFEGLQFIHVWDGWSRYEALGVLVGTNTVNPGYMGAVWRDKNDRIHVIGGDIPTMDGDYPDEGLTLEDLELPGDFTGFILLEKKMHADPIGVHGGPDTGAYHWTGMRYLAGEEPRHQPVKVAYTSTREITIPPLVPDHFMRPGFDVTMTCVLAWVSPDGLIVGADPTLADQLGDLFVFYEQSYSSVSTGPDTYDIVRVFS